MQAQLATLYLNPFGEQLVDTHDFLSQFTHIAKPLSIHLLLFLHTLDFGTHAVEIGYNGIYE